MSTQIIKVIIAGVLLLHGLGHGGALGALAFIDRGRPGGAWKPARSWLVPTLSAQTSKIIAILFWVLSLLGFVAAALSFWGILLPGDWWRQLALIFAFISFTGIFLFWGVWPMFNTLAAQAVNLAVIVTQLWLHWPEVSVFGKQVLTKGCQPVQIFFNMAGVINMATQSIPDFKLVFDRLLAVLSRYAREPLQLHQGTGQVELVGPETPTSWGKDVWFGAVRRGKRYVSYYLMPVYVFPELLENISPELKKRMQGKSCFNFTRVDEPLFAELSDLTARGYERYKEAGLVESA